MKIFVSYSRRDSGDFANQIHRHLSSFKHDIFTDVYDINGGEDWSNTIKTNISNCDIFVVIVTYGALQSSHVENEVLQAQREKKIIIPCFYRNVIDSNIKWGLDKLQGVEFSDKYEIARNLHSEIANISKEGIVTSTDLEDINTLINYGNILYDQAKYPEAVEWYDKVLRIDPNNESVRHKRFLAIQHLPKSSFKIYSNVKIRAKAITEELISYLQQKNFKVICNPDYKNNTYFINASKDFINTSKAGKLSKFMDSYLISKVMDTYVGDQDINIKVRDYLSNLEILLFTGEFKKDLLRNVSISLFTPAAVASPIFAIPSGIKFYVNNKLKDEVWNFIEQKISSY